MHNKWTDAKRRLVSWDADADAAAAAAAAAAKSL